MGFTTMKIKKSSIVIAGLLVLVISGGKYLYWAHVDNRFLGISEGKLYQSAEMPPGKLGDKIKAKGIRTVVDLRSPRKEVDRERMYLTELGVKYIDLPSGQHPEDHVIDSFLEIMAQKENLPVLVHCKHGMGRSVLLAALYRIEFEGWSKEDAMDKAFWQSGLGFEFLPSGDKGRFIKDYSPRLKFRHEYTLQKGSINLH